MSKLHTTNSTHFAFHCPGCEYSHIIDTTWQWNGSLDAPTFSPSYLIPSTENIKRCHSFIKDGKMEFLGDCEHDLKGQTVEIPEWPGIQVRGGKE